MHIRHFRISRSATLLFFSAAIASGQSQDSIDELKSCARTADQDSRMACYEELGKRLLAEDSEASNGISMASEPATVEAVVIASESNPEHTAPVAAGAAAVNTPQLSDDLGGESFDEKTEDESDSGKGLIVKCEKGSNKKWYFHFDSGQIWKQADDRRLRLEKECNVMAIISKDLFGYKMAIEGLDGRIRVARRK